MWMSKDAVNFIQQLVWKDLLSEWYLPLAKIKALLYLIAKPYSAEHETTEMNSKIFIYVNVPKYSSSTLPQSGKDGVLHLATIKM